MNAHKFQQFLLTNSGNLNLGFGSDENVDVGDGMSGSVPFLEGTGCSNLSMKCSVSSGTPALTTHPCDTGIWSMKK